MMEDEDEAVLTLLSHNLGASSVNQATLHCYLGKSSPTEYGLTNHGIMRSKSHKQHVAKLGDSLLPADVLECRM